MDSSNNLEIAKAFPGRAINFVVIVKEIENSNITEYGFDKGSLVDKNEKHKRGIVVSIGTSCPRDEDHVIKEGDEIIYDGYKTSPLSISGTEYKTLYYSDIIMSF